MISQTLTLDITIEKTLTALHLEHALGISFDLFQKYPFDAGYDVRAAIDVPFLLPPTSTHLIPTGLMIELGDPYWEIQVRPRSGLAAKNSIGILNSPGTVDYTYRKEIQVILHNYGNIPFKIEPGDRIAQVCFRPVPRVTIKYGTINKTIEGQSEERGGFGSSGLS